jgi:hypothetical protein
VLERGTFLRHIMFTRTWLAWPVTYKQIKQGSLSKTNLAALSLVVVAMSTTARV